jgi:chlorite dismutase
MGPCPKRSSQPQPEEPGYFSELMQDLQERAKQEVNTELDMAGAQINADSIMSRVNLQSIDKINALQQELDSTYKFWDNQLKTLNIEAETKAIENNIKKNKKSIKRIL